MPSKVHLEEQKRLLKMIPVGTWGVKVKKANGKCCFRDLSEVKPEDTILKKKDGTPIIMVNKPGRKKAVRLSPMAQTMLNDRDKAILENPIVKSALDDPDSIDVFNSLINGLARGIAVLEFEAERSIKRGDSAVNVLAKQMTTMRSTADLWLKRRDQLSSKLIDLDSPSFKSLFKFIMDTFRQALKSSGLRPEQIETIFGNVSSLLDGDWMEEAKNRMKDA
jgi:hypothetical protein